MSFEKKHLSQGRNSSDLVSPAVINVITKSELEGKGSISAYRLQSIMKEIQGGNPMWDPGDRDRQRGSGGTQHAGFLPD